MKQNLPAHPLEPGQVKLNPPYVFTKKEMPAPLRGKPSIWWLLPKTKVGLKYHPFPSESKSNSRFSNVYRSESLSEIPPVLDSLNLQDGSQKLSKSCECPPCGGKQVGSIFSTDLNLNLPGSLSIARILAGQLQPSAEATSLASGCILRCPSWVLLDGVLRTNALSSSHPRKPLHFNQRNQETPKCLSHTSASVD